MRQVQARPNIRTLRVRRFLADRWRESAVRTVHRQEVVKLVGEVHGLLPSRRLRPPPNEHFLVDWPYHILHKRQTRRPFAAAHGGFCRRKGRWGVSAPHPLLIGQASRIARRLQHSPQVDLGEAPVVHPFDQVVTQLSSSQSHRPCDLVQPRSPSLIALGALGLSPAR